MKEKNILVSMCLMLSMGITSVEAGAGARWRSWIDQQAEFPIGAWSYAWAMYNTPDDPPQSWYNLYEDAGLNMIQIHANQRAKQKAAGLNAVYGTWDGYHYPEKASAFNSALSLAADPANNVSMFLLKDDLAKYDESRYNDYYDQYDAINAIVNGDIYDLPSSVAVQIDFLPNWAVPASRFGVPYETMVSDGVYRCNPTISAHCNYPITFDSCGSIQDYFENLEVQRDNSYDVKGNTGAGTFALIGFTEYDRAGAVPRARNRQATLAECRWMLNTQLAYGAKGVWWYFFEKKKAGMEDFGDGFIKWDGSNHVKTSMYEPLKTLNGKIKNWVKLLELKSSKVCFAKGGYSMPEIRNEYAYGDMTDYFDIVNLPHQGALVAKLDHHHASKWVYIMVVNMDKGYARNFTLDFRDDLDVIWFLSKNDGYFYEVPNMTHTGEWYRRVDRLDPGDARLYALKRP